VIAIIGQPDRVVGRHEHAMGARVYPLAPAAQQIALAVEHAHRVLAAVEGVDVVVLVDADRGDIGVELHPRRQFRPAVIDLVAVAVRAQYDCHGASPSLALLRRLFISGRPGESRDPFVSRSSG
jgi:hypothetical protein